jgi:SAM-dependent methyltransferase
MVLKSPMPDAGPKQWFFDAWSLIYDLPLVQRATYRPVHDAVLHALGPAAGVGSAGPLPSFGGTQDRAGSLQSPKSDRLLAAPPISRVLDVGCGTGQLARRIQRARPAAGVVGCDFSAGMLRRAAVRSREVRWIQGDAGCLPFHDGSFDAVTSTEAFHWFPDQQAVLRECYRVLKPGGRLLLAMVNTPASVVSDAFYAGSRLVGEPFYWPTRREIRERVEAAGFVVERQQRVFRLPGFLLMPVLTHAVRPVAVSRRGRPVKAVPRSLSDLEPRNDPTGSGPEQ